MKKTGIVIANVDELPHSPVRIRSTGEHLTDSFDLTAFGDLTRFSVRHERLPAGHSASSAHAHSTREELVFVLRGTPSLAFGDETHVLGPGDFVAIAPGGAMHRLFNESAADAEYLLVASVEQGDVVRFAK